MQQHPIPQNVTQYQFRLVGDMTLKQFLELAFGLVLAYLFYASNLIFLLKWPLALLSLFLGFGLAFFPIEERPLDVWITNFLKSVYSPTRFVWQKTLRLPSLFLFEPSPRETTATAIKTVKAPTLVRPTTASNDLTATELTRLTSLNALFGQTPSPVSLPNAPTPPPPRPSVRVRKLSSPTVIFDATGSPAVVSVTPTIPVIEKPLTVPQATPIRVPSPPSPTPIYSSPTRVAGPLAPPTPPPTSMPPRPKVDAVAPKTINLPAPPKVPDLVVGMVVGQDGKMVENAIVQIIGSTGIPARAIKTNVLGQFYTSTPLAIGNYTIEVEKDGHTFPPTRLTTSGVLIPPLLIKAS